MKDSMVAHLFPSIRRKHWRCLPCYLNVWNKIGNSSTGPFMGSAFIPHVKSWLIGKDSDAGRDWEQEEKGMTEDEMAGWHHWLDGHESEWTPGAGDGQGGLVCCNSWGRKELNTTEWMNWTELIYPMIIQYLTYYVYSMTWETFICTMLFGLHLPKDVCIVSPALFLHN